MAKLEKRARAGACARLLPTVLFTVLCFVLLTDASPQAPQDRSSIVAQATEKIKRGDFVGTDVEEIARSGAVEAIPDLKEQFARSLGPSEESAMDPGNKAEIASALVRLGEKDPMYWDFLVKEAREAAESDIPYPNPFDADGRVIPRTFSAELLAWAKQHQVTPDAAAQSAIYEFPIALGFLALTADPSRLRKNSI